MGINKYTLTHSPWQLFLEARGMEEHLRVPVGWRGEGVIARIGSMEMAKELQKLGLPTVNVSGIQLPRVSFSRVTTNVEILAKLATRHFMERGFRHFAYFSLMGLSYVDLQQKAFTTAVHFGISDLM